MIGVEAWKGDPYGLNMGGKRLMMWLFLTTSIVKFSWKIYTLYLYLMWAKDVWIVSRFSDSTARHIHSGSPTKYLLLVRLTIFKAVL